MATVPQTVSPAETPYYKVTLNRFLSFGLMSIGLLFFWVGLDATFIHNFIKPENMVQENKHLFWVGFFFFVIVGGTIALNLAYYLIRPPSLMEVNSQGIRFGTGLRYNQFLIPWKYVESAGYGATATASNLIAGLQVVFTKAEEIPSSKVTSAGVIYSFHTLYLNRFYMAQSAKSAIEAIQEGLKRYK